MWATLSESITRNPFDERFTGVLFGFIVALPQFFYNRAFFLRYREALGQESAQLILDDETAAELGEIDRSDLLGSGHGSVVFPSKGGHHLVGCTYSYERGSSANSTPKET